MTKENYTSLELSEKIKSETEVLMTEKIWSKWYYEEICFGRGKELAEGDFRLIDRTNAPHLDIETDIPAYDILNDICVKYAKEFFGEGKYDDHNCWKCADILFLLQQGKKQEAEDYIWKNCLFNPKNK